MRFSSVAVRHLFWVAALTWVTQGTAAELRVLFLGDNGHHQPWDRFSVLAPALQDRGIQCTYVDRMEEITSENLADYDVLLLYGNIDRVEATQEQAILRFVSQGKGFVPVHCASYCFRNSPDLVQLIGAQFARHGVGTFRTSLVADAHPLTKGFSGFESWDETYVHHLHNEKDRTVLSYRVDADGREPWTWIRYHGQGRVFYTAWGHDQRTWKHAGFQNLLERGIRWAAKDTTAVPAYEDPHSFPAPTIKEPDPDVAEFTYRDVGARIPNYPKSGKWGTQAEPLRRMQDPVRAEESLRHVFVPEGFRVELFAADPDIQGKPICMTWDDRGRLWIAETYDYPNELQPSGFGRDRIRICEDTDGDWRADKFTVFAEQLSIPTSITFHDHGVIVQDGTRTLFLRDTNGDDVADERRTLFTGWNQRDTHGGVSNFQYGLDNWIYAMQGYNESAPTIEGEQQTGFRMGFFRFRPNGSEIEFLRSTNNNTWGLGISEEGVIFGSTANRNPSVYLPIPNRYYERVRGWTPSLKLGTIANTHLFQPVTERIRQVDQHGGYTAGAGHALYTARTYPQEYWNRTAFVCGPTGHLVGTFVLRPQGSDFRSEYTFNLFASDDEWTAPIMAEVGPDGNVWVLDWYNFIVQHNPTPAGFENGKGNAYRTNLRDKRHGRIYRVVYEPSAPQALPDLRSGDPETLLASLGHENLFWRRHAQRLLVERAKHDVVPALVEMVRDTSTDEIGLNVRVIHALWTLQGLAATEQPTDEVLNALHTALRHPSAGVRRNAVQVLPNSAGSVEQLIKSELLVDTDDQVQLAALLKFADLPATNAGTKQLTELFSQAMELDTWQRDALVSAIANHAHPFLQQMSAVRQRLSDEQLAIVRIVAEHFVRSHSSDGGPRILAEFENAAPSLRAIVLESFLAGWPAGVTVNLDLETSNKLQGLVRKLPVEQRGGFLRLVRRWGSLEFETYADQVVDELIRKFHEKQADEQIKIGAANGLIDFAPEDVRAAEAILASITPQMTPETVAELLAVITRSKAAEVGQQYAEKLGVLTPQSRSVGIDRAIEKPRFATALLAAIERDDLSIQDLDLTQRQRLLQHPNQGIQASIKRMLNQAGALPSKDRADVLRRLQAVTTEQGNPGAGLAAFKKVCAKCHIHGQEGSRIGPDLTGMAVHPKKELLVHILDPNRNVESNYRSYTAITNKGRVTSGMLAGESRTAIELFNAEGKKETILREDLDELVPSKNSLMPEGFEKQLSRIELRDLLEFLTSRGRFVPVDISMAATIASDRGMFYDEASDVERLIFPQWTPCESHGVPFLLIDPQSGRIPNTILLQGPLGAVSRTMPRESSSIPIRGRAATIHLLSGVSGWGYPLGNKGDVSMILRVRYADGATEDHEFYNGVHFADYIRRIDVPGSKFAFQLRGQQLRYLSIQPRRDAPIESIQFVKGKDDTAPIVMAVTAESDP